MSKTSVELCSHAGLNSVDEASERTLLHLIVVAGPLWAANSSLPHLPHLPH